MATDTDLVDESTDGLATEAGLAELGAKIAASEKRMTRNIVIVVVACTGVILAAMRLGI